MHQDTDALPILFFAFANDRREDGTFLPELIEERRQIQKAYETIKREQLCELIIEPAARIEDVYDVFQKSGSRIVLFHYAGHGGEDQLFLEADVGNHQSASSKGLIPLLQEQENLTCVFLNACSTSRQIRALQEAGIPFVIGTTQAINDTVARQFSIRFHKGLGLGRTLESAWKDSESEILARYGGNRRGLFRKSLERNQHPWEQLTKKGAESVLQWNIPALTRGYLFGLPKTSELYPLPFTPYRFLERYRRADANIFFGRNRYIRDLFLRISDRLSAPLILVTGQSGVGKSSLLEAGLIPRLLETHKVAVCRYRENSTLVDCLGVLLGSKKPNPSPESLLSIWADKEKDLPWLLILDQLELIFKKSKKVWLKELESFIEILDRFFPRTKPEQKNKIILSYRKEYNADFEAIITKAQLRCEKIFIEALDTEDIKEVITGLTTTPVLRRQYRLTVEDNLPTIVAHDLLSNPTSPVAPTLQIIISKMWSEQADEAQRLFSAKKYERLKTEGIFLDDFFNEQIAIIKNWAAQMPSDIESSGLAIDVLNFYTDNQIGVARSRGIEELYRQYQHRVDVLERLINKFIELRLLRKVEDGDTINRHNLVHDTLAPVVHKEFGKSSRKGQQAFRLLTTKLKVFEPQSDFILDLEDLALVEQGASGMRLWTEKEQVLIERSRIYRTKILAAQKLRKTLTVAGLFLIIILSVIATVFGFRANRLAKVNGLVLQAQQEAKYDATKALSTVQEALDILPEHNVAIQTRHDIYSYNELYEQSVIHQEAVKRIAFIDEGKKMVSASGRNVYLINDKGMKTDSLVHPDEILDLAVSPDGMHILTGCKDHIARIWTLDGRLLPPQFTHSDWVYSVAFSSDGQFILTGCRDGRVVLWQKNGLKIKEFKAHKEEVVEVAFSPKGNTVLTGSWDGQAKLWSRSGEWIHTFMHHARVLCIAFSPDGTRVLTGTRDGVARVWDIDKEYKEVALLKGHNKRINDLQFTPDGRQILTASDDYTAKLWDLNGELVQTYKGHTGFVHSLDFSVDGKYLLTASEDKTLKRWKKESKVIQTFGPHPSNVSAVTTSSDGRYVLTATGNDLKMATEQIFDLEAQSDIFDLFDDPKPHQVYLWDTNGLLLQTFRGHEGGISSLAISQNGAHILSGSEDATARLWNRQGELMQTFECQDKVNSVGFSPDGQHVLTGSSDGVVALWSLEGGQKLNLVHPALVASVAFHPEGQYFLVGCDDGVAYMYQLDGRLVREFRGTAGAVLAVTFSPDGKYFVLGEGGQASIVSLWNDRGSLVWRKSFELRDKTGGRGVYKVAFLESGKFIMVLLERGERKVLDLKGREVVSFTGLSEKVYTDKSYLMRRNKLIFK